MVTVAGSRHDRAAYALIHSGRAVLNAGATTLLAALILAFGSPIFQVFAKMLFGTVVFGLAHAVLLLPVLMSLIPGITPLRVQQTPDEVQAQAGSTSVFRSVMVMLLTVGGLVMGVLTFVLPWLQWQFDIFAGTDLVRA